MTTVADHSDIASRKPRTSRRQTLISTLADPSNWHKQHDCRPALRDAIDTLDEPALTRTWGRWLVDRLNADGELHHCDVGVIVRISPVSRRSTYRYLAVLERAGLIERHTTAVQRRGQWRRTTTITAAREFRRADQPKRVRNPLTCDSATSGTVPTLVVNSKGSVGDLPTDRRDDEQISDGDRRALDAGWALMARSRTDVPMLRPGYGTNTHDPAERERLMLPPLSALLAADPVTDYDEGPF